MADENILVAALLFCGLLYVLFNVFTGLAIAYLIKGVLAFKKTGTPLAQTMKPAVRFSKLMFACSALGVAMFVFFVWFPNRADFAALWHALFA